MESIEVRYYLQSNNSSFRSIYSRGGKLLPTRLDDDVMAVCTGKFFADKEKLSSWWVEKEVIKTTRTTIKIS